MWGQAQDSAAKKGGGRRRRRRRLGGGRGGGGGWGGPVGNEMFETSVIDSAIFRFLLTLWRLRRVKAVHLLLFLFLFPDFRFLEGSGFNRGRSPGEWGDFLPVFMYVCLLPQPARHGTQPANREGQPTKDFVPQTNMGTVDHLIPCGDWLCYFIFSRVHATL